MPRERCDLIGTIIAEKLISNEELYIADMRKVRRKSLILQDEFNTNS